MSVYSRGTYPENFFDITSDELLLQPEPQYLFARMLYAAMMAELGVPDAMGLPGRQTPNVGAPYVTPESQRLDLNGGQEIAAQVFACKIDFTAKPGNTVRLNRPLYPNTTYTTASRQIASGATISTTPIAPGSEQTDLTIYRYAGPYDQGNTRVAPYGLDAFDANMGVHKAAKIVGGNLKRDYDKFIDSVWVSLMENAKTNYYPKGFAADNDIVSDTAAPMDFDTIARAEEGLDTANIPYFGTGKRICVLTPAQLRQLKNDAQYARYSEFHPEFNALFPEYVSDIGKFHILKSNTLTRKANSTPINVDHGVAFGPGVFGAGMGRSPRVMPSTDDNYGETQKVIWLADLGFLLANNTFVVGLRTSTG